MKSLRVEPEKQTNKHTNKQTNKKLYDCKWAKWWSALLKKHVPIFLLLSTEKPWDKWQWVMSEGVVDLVMYIFNSQEIHYD